MRFEVDFPEDLFAQLDAAGDMDRIAPAMLSRAAPSLENAIRKRAQLHDQTGEMSRSVKAGKPRKNKRTGNWGVRVRFVGYDKTRKPTPNYPRGVPNAVKAAGIEYGNDDANRVPHPFMAAAAKDAQNDIDAALQRAYDDEVQKK